MRKTRSKRIIDPQDRKVIRCPLNVKFNKHHIVPSEVVGKKYFDNIGDPNYEFKFVTIDGVDCDVKFMSCWNNSDKHYNDELNNLCIKFYNIPFSIVLSEHINRLGFTPNYWYWIELIV